MGASTVLLRDHCAAGSGLIESELCLAFESEPRSKSVPFVRSQPQVDQDGQAENTEGENGSDAEQDETETGASSDPDPETGASSDPDPETRQELPLLERLIDWIDELLDDFDVEVAGIQVFSTTGLAAGLLAALALGLLLAGMGMLKLPGWNRGSD